MGNCWSKTKSAESVNPSHHGSTPYSPPPVESSLHTSGDPLRFSPPMDPLVPMSGYPVHHSPPLEPFLPTSGDPVPPSATPMEPSLPSSGDLLPPSSATATEPFLPTSSSGDTLHPSPPVDPSLFISGDPVLSCSATPMEPSLPTSRDPVPQFYATPMEPSLPTSRDPVRPPPPVDPSLTVHTSLPMEPSLPISGDPGPSFPSIDAIESIKGMYKKIDPVELIDPLVGFIENHLQKMIAPSEAESSSSEGWLATVGKGIQQAAATVNTISKEAEKVSESDAVKEMGRITLKVLEGMEEAHQVYIGLSIAALAAETYTSVGSTKVNECRELLLKTLQLSKDVTVYAEQMWRTHDLRISEEKEKLCNAVAAIVEGAVIACNNLNGGKVFSLWSATTAAAQLEKTNQQLRTVVDSVAMSSHLRQKNFSGTKIKSPMQLKFKPIGIEDKVREVKALLDMKGSERALAVIVYGVGGVGKSTLAASVVESLHWSSTDFKFCTVAIDWKTPDKISHIINLQKHILYVLGVERHFQNPVQGRHEIKEALKKKKSLLFIDNVVDKGYLRDLLPNDLLSGEQETKLRIIITSRKENVKTELGIRCKLYEMQVLSHAEAKILFAERILEGYPADLKGEEGMINELVDACQGVPLLLSVFGRHLSYERNKDGYLEALKALREGNLDSYRDEDLGSRLMFVYDKIKDIEVKEAFLDICTYFHGWQWNLVSDIVNISKLKDLLRRMLISKTSSGEVIVHDILRLMGMEKAKLTRFLNYKELSQALEGNSDGFDMKAVKGISLFTDNRLITIESTKLEAMSISLRVLMLGDWVILEGPQCQRAFKNLRYLRVGDSTVFPFKDPSKLYSLRVFVNRSTPGMNLSFLPSSLQRISHEVAHTECDKFVKLPFQNLMSLKSLIFKTHKQLELPEELHLPPSLVDLNISRCKNLPKDIGHLTVLESLILDGSDLECLPRGFGELKKLKNLSMNNCSKMTVLPDKLGMLSSLEALSMKGCRNLTVLPGNLGGLLSLQTIEFSECIQLQELPESFGELRIESLNIHSLDNLIKLPNSFGNMILLKDLTIESCCSLVSLPDSFVQLKMLETLKIVKCTKLNSLPEDFGRLRCLKSMTVEECSLLKELPCGFGTLPALKTFTLRWCNSFMNFPSDFRELISLEKLYLEDLPLMPRIPDGFGNLKSLRFLDVCYCFQLKTLSEDFENMATLEQLRISKCPELDGVMMEKILKLPNCYMVDIDDSSNLLEKWEDMQGESEGPMVVVSKVNERDREEKRRTTKVALLHGKCVEVKNGSDQLVERTSLLVGLKQGSAATVALIMLPIHMQSDQHQTLQEIVEMARETAETNGSGNLQIVCARKVDLDAVRPTPTEEEERAEEEGIRQILLSLPKGSCAISSSEWKRVKILTYCLDLGASRGSNDKFSIFMANVWSDNEGRKIFENLRFIEDNISGHVHSHLPSPSPLEIRKAENKHYNSIQNFIKSLYSVPQHHEEHPIYPRITEGQSESQCVRGGSKTREFKDALEDNGIKYLLSANNTSKVMVDDLHGKTIGFIVCDFKFLECIKLEQVYKDLQEKDSNFIWIWIPLEMPKGGHGSYTRLIQRMPWATCAHPQMVNIKNRTTSFVLLDEHGQIANRDALSLLLAWGVKSYPFTQHSIPESLLLVESETCLEFLLHGMNIVGRKQMESKMTFLYAENSSKLLTMKSKLEELTYMHGNFEVLYVGNFSERDISSIENLKRNYETATQNMRWPSLSLSDMIKFWYRCKHLASEEVYQLSRESSMMMQLRGFATQLYRCRPSLVLVDKDGPVTYRGEDVVQMICEPSHEIGDGEGMEMRRVKYELKRSLNRGECSSDVKTFFRDEFHNYPRQLPNILSTM